MQADLRDRLLGYLASHNVMTLATHGPEGPWASAVFYVNDGFALYFLSAPGTRHCRNLADDPRVAASVQEDYAEWREIKGVQLQGRVARLDVPAGLRAAALYARKFAFADPARATGAIAAAFAKIAWYRLEPDFLYLIDNSLGLGHRERFSLDSMR